MIDGDGRRCFNVHALSFYPILLQDLDGPSMRIIPKVLAVLQLSAHMAFGCGQKRLVASYYTPSAAMHGRLGGREDSSLEFTAYSTTSPSRTLTPTVYGDSHRRICKRR